MIQGTTQGKSRLLRPVLALCFMGACLAGALVAEMATMSIGHCSFVEGNCRYDPRTQTPFPLFIEQPPEQFVVQYIEQQVAEHGTFPANAGSSILSVTPVYVSAGGFYTDWHVVARVAVKIDYTDGSSRNELFETMEKGASTLFGIENTTIRTRFGPLTECDNPSVGHWVCR